MDKLNCILAIFFFISFLVYKSLLKKEPVQLSELVKCTLAVMGLPVLFNCLFLLITNSKKAVEMAETKQLLTIAVLIIIYISVVEVKKAFESKKN